MATGMMLRYYQLVSTFQEAVINAANKDQQAKLWLARSVLTEFADDNAESREIARERWQQNCPESDWTNELEDEQNVTKYMAMTSAKLVQAEIDKQYAIYFVRMLGKASVRAYDDWQDGGLSLPPRSCWNNR